MLRTNQNYSNNLLYAARINDTERAIAILRSGRATDNFKLVKDIRPSSSGWTAAHWAAFHNNERLTKEILAVFPNAYKEKTSAPWFFGYFGFNGDQLPTHLIAKGSISDSKEESKISEMENKMMSTYSRHVRSTLRKPGDWIAIKKQKDAQGNCLEETFIEEKGVGTLLEDMHKTDVETTEVLSSMVKDVEEQNFKAAFLKGIDHFVAAKPSVSEPKIGGQQVKSLMENLLNRFNK